LRLLRFCRTREESKAGGATHTERSEVWGAEAGSRALSILQGTQQNT